MPGPVGAGAPESGVAPSKSTASEIGSSEVTTWYFAAVPQSRSSPGGSRVMSRGPPGPDSDSPVGLPGEIASRL